MAITRYTASADTTITNAYKGNLTQRATGSNMGASDILEVFSIFAQESSASAELARTLIKFPTDMISSDRSDISIPVSGSVNFFLKLYNARHSETIPSNYTLTLSAVKTSWEEGTGMDMEDYLDIDEASWVKASADTSWTTAGGDFYSDTSSSFSASFDSGLENIELDITTLVEQWVNSSGNVLGNKSNYGLLVRMSPSHEDIVLSNTSSYYTKRFFGRGTEFFYEQPTIEARWDSSEKDDRGNFYYSSSLAPAADNLNTLYLYNFIRGQLKNIPGVDTGTILVSLYSGSSSDSAPSGSKLNLSVGGDVAAAGDLNATGGYISTGIYTCSLAYTGSTSLKTVYDVWHSNSIEYVTGTVVPKSITGGTFNPNPKHITKITNLRDSYSPTENARFRLYVREKDWNPSIYSKASMDIENSIIDNAYYKISRVADNLKLIDFGTGSIKYTRLSHDVSGNYFDLDMSLFQSGYMYGVNFAYHTNGKYVVQPETFKFRVD